ncbi:hypothetical protein [Sphingomonas sp.]|uniref:hypothetical protein n=1 Tax=Sphingomonas sp. TaxID=28214 RepID=UPI003D6D16D3
MNHKKLLRLYRDPAYPLLLFQRMITVSLETMKIVWGSRASTSCRALQLHKTKTPAGFPTGVLLQRNLCNNASIRNFPRGMILHSEALLPWLPYRFAKFTIAD